MAWSQQWPVEAGDTVSLAHAEDLVDEFNARRPSYVTALSDPSAGESAWDFIQRVRGKIESVLRISNGPDKAFFDFATGLQFQEIGDADDTDGISAFGKVLGAGRLAWRNDGAGNEASGPGWDPLQCTSQDSACYTFHFNELRDMIDEVMVWQQKPLTGHAEHLRKGPVYTGYKATEEDAIDELWDTTLPNASPQHKITSVPPPAVLVGCTKFPEGYEAWGGLYRRFYDVDIPDDCQACYVYTRRFYDNWYQTGASTYAKHPQWSWYIYRDDDSPDYADLTPYWDYGTLEGTIACPDVYSKAGTGEPQYQKHQLGDWSAGDTVYFQFRVDETKQDHLATYGYWPDYDTWAEARKSVQAAGSDVYLLWTTLDQS